MAVSRYKRVSNIQYMHKYSIDAYIYNYNIDAYMYVLCSKLPAYSNPAAAIGTDLPLHRVVELRKAG